MSFEWVEIGELQAKKNGSIDPSKFLDETFELHSIPSHDKGNAEILTGREIGSSKQIVQENDVMISKIVPHIRRAMVVPKKGDFRQIASGEWIVFRSEKVYPNYLRHLLISDFFNAEFMATVSGVGGSLLRARPAFVSKIKIPLPPLSEQKRIADILDKAEELRQKRQQSIEKLDELLQATFIDMFGDPVTNPNKHKTDILANYVLKDFQNGLYKPASFYGSGTPILRIDGYRNGDIINESNFKRLELEPSEIEKYKLTKMDLVINRVNSPEYLGKIALFMDDREDTVFESNMMRFSIRQELLNVYYLIFLFKQRYISNQIATKRKDAVNQSSINQQDVKSLILNVPNIKLQNKWAELYQSCNMQKKILTSQLNQQETLFQSLQQRAFNGEL